MKKNNYFTLIVLLLIASLSFSACSKDKDDDNDLSGQSGLSMKVNGAAWGTTINTLFTEPEENSQLGEYYVVLVGGQRIDVEGSEDDVSSFNMYIVIPKSKFSNPKGTYHVYVAEGAMPGAATASYTKSTSEGTASYESANPADYTQSVGSVQITDFEIGEQTIVGQPTGVEGYTKLSGTFQMDVYPVQETPGPALKITEGKFSLKSGIGFDF